RLRVRVRRPGPHRLPVHPIPRLVPRRPVRRRRTYVNEAAFYPLVPDSTRASAGSQTWTYNRHRATAGRQYVKVHALRQVRQLVYRYVVVLVALVVLRTVLVLQVREGQRGT